MTPYDHANPPPPTILQLRGPENEVLWEGPTPLTGLTGIVGTVCYITSPDGVLVYALPTWREVHAGEALTFGPASSGEASIDVWTVASAALERLSYED